MRIKLEVLSKETISYQANSRRPAGQFDVLNCREATPATLLAPVRLSARDFSTVLPGTIVEVAVSEVMTNEKNPYVSVRGHLVNGK